MRILSISFNLVNFFNNNFTWRILINCFWLKISSIQRPNAPTESRLFYSTHLHKWIYINMAYFAWIISNQKKYTFSENKSKWCSFSAWHTMLYIGVCAHDRYILWSFAVRPEMILFRKYVEFKFLKIYFKIRLYRFEMKIYLHSHEKKTKIMVNIYH